MSNKRFSVPFLVFRDDGMMELSESGQAILKYNSETNTLEVSVDGAAYAEIGSGGGGGGGGAPLGSPYITASASGTLTDERVLTAGTGIALTDGGANSTMTVGLTSTGITPGAYTSVDITVDATGRITAIANGAGGGSIDGSGAAGELAYWSDSNTLTSDPAITFNGVALAVNAPATFNGSGLDVDYRFESNNNANMFFIDGGADRIGVGTNTPSATLDVQAGTQTTLIPGFQLTSTLPNPGSTDESGLLVSVTSAGAGTSTQLGLLTLLNAGYTGSSATYGIDGVNLVAGVAAGALSGVVKANYGFNGVASSTTVGDNVGGALTATGGNRNIGLTAFAQSSKANAKNIGVYANGENGGGGTENHIGGLFTVGGSLSDPVLTQSAALIADNRAEGSAIFIARDNGAAVFTIADGGVLTQDGGAVFNEAGANVDFRIEGDTDANLFFVDASTDFIGIGNNSPGHKLQVTGNVIGAVTANNTITVGSAQGSNGTAAQAQNAAIADNSNAYIAAFSSGFTAGSNIPQASGAGLFFDLPNTSEASIATFRNAASSAPMVFYVGQVGLTKAGAENFRLTSTGAVFNEEGRDLDFRIESDTNANMFFVDAGNNRIGVLNNAPTTTVDISGDSTGDIALRIANSNAGSVASAYLGLASLSASGSLAIYNSSFAATNYADKIVLGAGATATGLIVSAEATGGTFEVYTDGIATTDQRLVMNDTATVFNEQSNDTDFRIESNGNANMFFVDGGTDRVGIGTASPTDFFHVVAGSLATGRVAQLVSGTLSNAAADQHGARYNFTGAGTADVYLNGLASYFIAGYTGVGATIAIYADNLSAGTGTTPIAAGKANYGFFANAYGATSGHNVGAEGNAQASTVRNIGFLGRASTNGGSPQNIGVLGISTLTSGSPTRIGGMFSLHTTDNLGTLVSTALRVSNSSVAAHIIDAYDDDTSVFRIADGGAMTHEGGAVFNETGADVDFRIEGDTEPNLFFVDAGNGRVGMYTSAPAAEFQIVRSNNADVAMGVSNTNGGAAATASVGVVSTTSSGALFAAPAAYSITTYADKAGFFASTSSTGLVFSAEAASGTIEFFTDGTLIANQRAIFGSTEAVFNEQGNDTNFRVESDTSTNALFVDAGLNTVQQGAGQAWAVASSAGSPSLSSSNMYMGITDTSSARTVSLPASASCVQGQVFIVKDESGAAGTNNITIDADGADTIDGAGDTPINTNFGSKTLILRGTNWNLI